MSEKLYRVMFQGLVAPESEFRERMSSLGVESKAVDRVLSDAPVAMKSALTLGEARQYAETVQEAGGRVLIQEQEKARAAPEPVTRLSIPSLGQFTVCPRCGRKQVKGGACERCGCLLP